MLEPRPMSDVERDVMEYDVVTVGAGPSGLVFYPGLGLPERYRDHFFLCDFLGGDSYSRILALALEPVGAGFKVVDEHPFAQLRRHTLIRSNRHDRNLLSCGRPRL